MLELNGIQINVIAVAVAAVASFLLGFAWYAAIFAKPWMKEMGYDPAMRPDGKTMARGIALLLLGSFLFAWVLAFYLAGWKFIPGSAGTPPAFFALNSALSVWIGFFLPIHLSRMVWERHSLKLFAINSGYNLISAILVGMILALWS